MAIFRVVPASGIALKLSSILPQQVTRSRVKGLDHALGVGEVHDAAVDDGFLRHSPGLHGPRPGELQSVDVLGCHLIQGAVTGGTVVTAPPQPSPPEQDPGEPHPSREWLPDWSLRPQASAKPADHHSVRRLVEQVSRYCRLKGLPLHRRHIRNAASEISGATFEYPMAVPRIIPARVPGAGPSELGLIIGGISAERRSPTGQKTVH